MKSVEILKNMMHPNHYYRTEIKSWGWEYWFENNKQYCGKIIQVRQNHWSSHGAFHYHKIKDETFLVLSGTLLLDILILDSVSPVKLLMDNEIRFIEEVQNHGKTVIRCHLKPFNYIRLKPGVLHRFSALTPEAIFTETSTTHREEDSYRIKRPTPEEQLKFKVEHIYGQVNLPAKTDRFSYQYKGEK